MSQREYSKRLSENQEQLKTLYFDLYQQYGAGQKDYKRLLSIIAKGYDTRKSALRKIDMHQSGWNLAANNIGMTLYVDTVSKNFSKFKTKIPYLLDLGITIVHFLPFFDSNEQQSVEDTAVISFKHCNTAFGSMEDFENLCDALRKEGIFVCLDLPVHGVSKEHEWAKLALAGDVDYQKRFIMVEDVGVVASYNRTIPISQSNAAEGCFTFESSLLKYVYTSFGSEQFDFNYKNPLVFEYLVDTLLWISNLGVNVIQLNHLDIMWKQVGTTSKNLPEVHKILALLHVIKNIVAPSVVLASDSNVESYEVSKYFGEEFQPEITYMNNHALSVNAWNALATRDTRLMNVDKQRVVLPSQAGWFNYIRNEKPLNWNFNEAAALALKWDPQAHKQFLIRFYSDVFDGSFALGKKYKMNPTTHDAQINGTFASLIGLEKARNEHDVFGEELAVKRMLLIHALLLTERGIPMFYAGDEICAFNARLRPEQDERDLHKNKYQWDLLDHPFSNPLQEGYRNQVLKLNRLRKEDSIFDTNVQSYLINATNHSIYSFFRRKNNEIFIGIFNFSEYPQNLSSIEVKQYGVQGKFVDKVQGKVVDLSKGNIYLHPYEFLWLKNIQ
ncbi:MAG: alpha-amylase family glycosyl hydrolase [Erysipelotrichaceae bacterium]